MIADRRRRREAGIVHSAYREKRWENGHDKHLFVNAPAREEPKQVVGTLNPTREGPVKDAPRCKKRPDSKKPSSRGKGNARPFVPWCK